MTSVTVMVIFFESGILKVTWSQLCSNSPFSTITRHIDNSILKDTLQLYILRTWINMRAKSFIKTSVNVTETKIDEAAWKKINHAKLQACTWKDIWLKIETTFHLFYALLFLWNLDFRFNIVLIGNFFIISSTIYLLSLPFFQHLIYRRP